jgi:hypothetical protein
MAVDREELVELLKLQMAEIDRLRAEAGRRDAELEGLVNWIAGDAGALEALQAAYADPRSSPSIKVRAASAAVAYERSKPPTAVVFNFGDELREARLRHMAEARERLLRGEEPRTNPNGTWQALTTSKIIDGEKGPEPAA